MFCKTNALNIPETAGDQFTDDSVKFHICTAMENFLPPGPKCLARQLFGTFQGEPALEQQDPQLPKVDRRCAVIDRGKP